MRNKIRVVLLSMIATVAFGHAALAFDVNAGPILDNAGAQKQCPAVCSGMKWNGQWATTVPGQMSVCGTEQKVDVPVGPIFSNDQAKTACPSQLSKVNWGGQWTTTVPGQMSVCGCNPPSPLK